MSEGGAVVPDKAARQHGSAVQGCAGSGYAGVAAVVAPVLNAHVALAAADPCARRGIARHDAALRGWRQDLHSMEGGSSLHWQGPLSAWAGWAVVKLGRHARSAEL